MMPDPAPEYVQARRVLLDAIEVLAPHRRAIVVAGAQAVYLRTGAGEVAIAPYTTDGDLALDPSLLGDEPDLERVMTDAGFALLETQEGRTEPGIWVGTASIDGREFLVPIDLIVPEGVAEKAGRRAARLPGHGKRAARRAVGLEASLVDHSTMTIAALDPRDGRAFDVEVAGIAALLVAKAHKIHDRVAAAKPDRLIDKDAADALRLMQAMPPPEMANTLAGLRRHETAGPSTEAAIGFIFDLFGSRRGEGVQMATRSLRLAVPEERVTEYFAAYVAQLRDALGM